MLASRSSEGTLYSYQNCAELSRVAKRESEIFSVSRQRFEALHNAKEEGRGREEEQEEERFCRRPHYYPDYYQEVAWIVRRKRTQRERHSP